MLRKIMRHLPKNKKNTNTKNKKGLDETDFFFHW